MIGLRQWIVFSTNRFQNQEIFYQWRVCCYACRADAKFLTHRKQVLTVHVFYLRIFNVRLSTSGYLRNGYSIFVTNFIGLRICSDDACSSLLLRRVLRENCLVTLMNRECRLNMWQWVIWRNENDLRKSVGKNKYLRYKQRVLVSRNCVSNTKRTLRHLW